MISVFTGEDTYRSHAAYIRARVEAEKKNGLKVLRDENLTEDNLAASLRGQTLFGEAPAIAVEGATVFTGQRAENIIGIIAGAKTNTNILFWEKGKPEVRLKVWGFLKKNAEQWENFDLLSGQELGAWINKNVQEKGGKINPAAIAVLDRYCGSNLWTLTSEIEKLLLYVQGKEIQVQDVNEITPASSEFNIFSTVRAFTVGDGKTAIKNLVASRKAGEDSRPILSLATREVRAMLAIRDLLDQRLPVKAYQLASEIGVPGFVIEALLRQANSTTTVKTKRLFDQLVVSLYALNNGKAEPDDVLDSIAFQNLS